MPLSNEQLVIANCVANETCNIIVRARAGCGKSFTIRHVLPLFAGKCAVMAFGKEAALEMQMKCNEEGIRNADIATFHSFGLRALRGVFPNPNIVPASKKFDVIAERLAIPQTMQAFVQKAMSLAMQRGFGIFHKINSKAEWFKLIDHFDLEDCFGEDNLSVQMKGREAAIMDGIVFACKAIMMGVEMLKDMVSFDDMMFAPLFLNVKFPEFANVIVDEFQDSNPCRREIARRMMTPGTGRFMGVGDDMQAIMGFTGADNDAMDQGIEEFNAKVLPLTMTRRCSKVVVKMATQIVPDFTCADENAEGSTSTLSKTEFLGLDFVPGEDAIICRKTAPIVSVCYSLLARGINAKVVGKDIAEGLIKLVTRWKVKTLVAFQGKLDTYFEKQIVKLTAEKKMSQAENLTDKVEAIKAIMSGLARDATLSDLVLQIEKMFTKAPDGTEKPFVALMTAHKSKGLEFRRVFGFGNAKWFPSKFAKQDWQLHQEECLLYVLWTRTMEDYVDVVVDDE